MQEHPMPVRRWLFASLAAATVPLSARGGGVGYTPSALAWLGITR
jgi:hypothetical protein